ncbi:hypothetical protein PRIC1_013779 [Phytophthora ramorum]
MRDVVDATEDGASASRKRRAQEQELDEEPSTRRTHRKIESRVLFSDVLAQTREIEHYEKSRPLRKGETADSPAQRSKQKRAEERRSQRQKLRRNLSPRSPDGGPQLPLRSGVALVALDEELVLKRRFARDEDAIQDASLHSTAWRNIKFDSAPPNLLPTRDDALPPYALQLDAPLDDFHADLQSKCKVLTHFLRPKPLTLTSGSLAEARDSTQMEDKVRALIDEATPLVKQGHAARVKVVIANTRQQVAAYLEERPVARAQASTIAGLPLQISKLEKVAARRMLRNAEFTTDGEDQPHYAVGRTESGHAGDICPGSVTYFSKIAPIPRSTTCMLARGTHRVEDDPIIRFVPYFSAGSKSKAKGPQVSSTERCKDTLVGMDDEINEYVLRYVVASCGGDQTVFEALQRSGAFAQPFAHYSGILERVTREQLYTRRLHELEALKSSDGISAHRKQALSSLLDECNSIRSGAHLRDRLHPVPSHVVWNLLEENGDLGMRDAPSKQYRDVAMKYQDFFCRRCCMYSCRNHGREQPVPVVRVDPKYPSVKASSKLWRRVEEELMAEEQAEDSVEDTDVLMDDDQSPEAEPMLELAPTASTECDPDTDNDPARESMRRSLRAQTAASTKASSKLNATRFPTKKVSRTKTTDVSEYLGYNSVYQALTQDKRLELLSAEARCGPYCSKPVSGTISADQINGFDTSQQEKPWNDSEIVLLNKLEKCVGPNPCLLAMLLTTRTCSDVAALLNQRNDQATDDLRDINLIRSGVYGRNRERSNGVLGNSYEHLRRTRSQRMKDRVVVADEKSSAKTAAQLKICGNVNILRGQMRKIGVAASKTHGWGAFAMENVKKGEFMYEYTGSLLSQDEAERRGNVYDKTTISFLFDLTEDSVVDANRKGNKSKFANHDSKDPKCFARIMLVNGDHRIGIYAKQDLSAGEELFFDYGYSGVIPDWSQARIGSGKDAPPIEEEDETKESLIEVKEDIQS